MSFRSRQAVEPARGMIFPESYMYDTTDDEPGESWETTRARISQCVFCGRSTTMGRFCSDGCEDQAAASAGRRAA